MKLILIMAINLLYTLHFVTAPDAANFPLWAANTTLKVNWDDSVSAIKANLYNGAGALIDTPLVGPNLVASWTALNTRVVDAQYQFCLGTTLNYFSLDLNIFPYAIRNQSPNSNVCQTIVCDLVVVNVATIPATGALNQDGSASVNATSTHGPIKYKLNSSGFDYSSDGQLSNIFTSLLPGTYGFCTIDSYLCKKTGVFVILNTDTYVERWRSDFKEITTNYQHRLIIEDRQFVGAVTDIKMDIAAAQVSWRGEAVEDSFSPVVSSQMTTVLFSETDQQFVDLYTTDERRFKLKKYINTGTGLTLQWVGFVSPMLYSEPYTEATNYPVNVVATDRTGKLSAISFSNDQGLPYSTRISYMDAISAILRKTGFQLSIKESVNMFETTMAQTASDSCLTQCTIDPDAYKNSDGTFQDCLTVLKSLVSNIGSRLYMDNGQWNIDFVEQKSATSIPYRIFNYLGVYSSNGTYDPTINIGTSFINNRIVPLGGAVSMNIIQSYGTFKFVNALQIVNNLLRGGDMEANDNTGSNPTLKGWSVDSSQAPGVAYGLEKLDKDNRGSKYAAYFDFKNCPAGAYVTLQSDSFSFILTQLFTGKLIFDAYIRPVYTDTYVFLDYEVRMGTMYMSNEGSLTDGRRNMTTTPSLELSGEYNRVFATEFLTWKTIQWDFYGWENALTGNGFVKFRIQANPAYDYSSLANLQAAVTADGVLMAQSKKARVLDTTILRWYTLNAGADATSSPDKLRPTDWSAGNPMYWKLDKTTQTIAPNNWIQSILIDNVQLVYLPGGIPPDNIQTLSVPLGSPPVDSIFYNQTTNQNILNTLTKVFNHGDIPIADSNYKFISKGHLRLLNGTPTTYWKRSYVANEAMPLVQLLQYVYVGQFQAPKYKLSGNWGYDLPVSFSNTFNELRVGKRYLPNAMTLNYADSSMSCEMLELKQSVAGGPPPDIAEFGLDFGLDFAS